MKPEIFFVFIKWWFQDFKIAIETFMSCVKKTMTRRVLEICYVNETLSQMTVYFAMGLLLKNDQLKFPQWFRQYRRQVLTPWGWHHVSEF